MIKHLKIILIIAILIFIGWFVIKVLPLFLPIKYAISEKDLLEKNEYIICEVVRSTGVNWIVIDGSKDRYQSNISLADIQGENPFKTYSYSIETGENKYVFYGDYIYLDSYDIHGAVLADAILFETDEWDILYPIHRNDLLGFILPKNYLCLYDTAFTFAGLKNLMKGRYIWNYNILPLPR